MSAPLKVGDRVAVYDDGSRSLGTIIEIGGTGLVWVRQTHVSVIACHPKQLRRLKPKRERRRVWIAVTNLDLKFQEREAGEITVMVPISDRRMSGDLFAEFVEVRKGKANG